MDHPTAQEIARGLEKCQQVGPNRYKACCPSHTEKSPSFYITEGRERILFKCFAGCSQEAIIQSLRDLGLWPQPQEKPEWKKKEPLPSNFEWDHALMMLRMVDNPNTLSQSDRLVYNKSLALYQRYVYHFGDRFHLTADEVGREMEKWVKLNWEALLAKLREGR